MNQEEISSSYVLDRAVFEYHLDTITNRNETEKFEVFCRKLCEQAICQNLRSHTGPDGGGDSKVDTETYPVSDDIVDNFYVGEGGTINGRWAFAFSAKENWKEKVEKDVKKIAKTGRGYEQIVFVTSRFAKDSTRSQVEDSLSEKYGIRVIIYDRSWIVQETIDKGRKNLAFEYLGVGKKITDPHRLAPTVLVNQKIENEVDTLRKTRFFNEVNRIDNTLVLGGQLVDGELSSGSHDVRSRALAWCARLLARSEETKTAEEYLESAKQLGACPEINIAEAFIISQAGDKKAALGALATIDTPSARSAALMVVSHHESTENAIDWFKKTGIDSYNMDSDGKFFLLSLQLELAQWKDAEKTFYTLSDCDLANTPALHHIAAITCLLGVVPPEFRPLVIKQVPLDSARFPLASDSSSMDIRRTALYRFSKAVEVERQLNCHHIASLDDEYALWLELRNPETAAAGRERLKDKLSNPKLALRWIPLGLNFGINFDVTAVEQEIEKNTALHGGVTHETATARFALALSQKSPKDVVDYIEQHYDNLSKFLGKNPIDALQIEALAHAGKLDKAKQILSKSKLSEEDKTRLRIIIATDSGADPIELRKKQFEQSDNLNDLIALVNELEVQQNWPELCEFGNKLFQRTLSVADAERLAVALTNAQRNNDLLEFLKTIPNILQQSKHLRMSYCWALYNEGHFSEAQTELEKISDAPDGWEYRTLRVNLGIALGDWSSLSTYVTEEHKARDNRNALDLIQTAHLAHLVNSPLAKDITTAAVTKGNHDPEVLVAAYYLAQTAGWEKDETFSRCFQKAAELSGDDGPIWKMTLKDLLDRKPEWDRHESKIWQVLGRGDIPTFLASEAINKTLINLMLFSTCANLLEHDPRRRGAIPAYSGKRHPLPLDVTVKTIGMDVSALLTLSFLNILDKTLDTFETVHVSHSTSVWLFEEKQKVAFHQPSRIRDASEVHKMLATNVLEKFVPSTTADSDLSALVGNNLAMLITEAEKIRDDKTQHIVVCPYPVYRIDSFMDEKADLTKHANTISSCQAVVKKLKNKGKITADEETKALDYLRHHEKEPWPQQPDISDEATLYLDDLAIEYFLHLEILHKLKAAGFTAIASPREVSEANNLISYESNADEVIKIIERIQNSLKSRIESGKIKFDKKHKLDGLERQSIAEHPTASVFALAEVCDAVIIDDRFINQHANIGDADMQASIFSTLDLLDGLTTANIITSDQRMEYRTELRCAGYFFIPVQYDELVQHLNACLDTDGEFNETAELRAIRENILRVRMSDWLQLPKEAPWLHTTTRAFVTALKGLWKADADISKVKAISNWIADQIDTRGWAHCLDTKSAAGIIKTGQGNHIFLLLTPPLDTPKNIQEAYWKWVEYRVLDPIKEQFPEIYNWIVDLHRQQISDVVDKFLDQEAATDSPNVRPALVRSAFEHVPPLIRETLINQRDFCEEYGFKADATIVFSDIGISIQRSKLFEVVRDVFSNRSEVVVTDVDGCDWKVFVSGEERKYPQILISNNDRQHILPDYFIGLSSDSATRLRWLEETAIDVNLPVDATTTWRDILSKRSLEDGEVDLLHKEIRDTPTYMARLIHNEIQKGRIDISSLVPSSRRYFTRLVGEYEGSSSIRNYAIGAGKSFMEGLLAWRPYDGFLFSLLLSSHSALTAEINVEQLDDEDIVRAFEFLIERGDKLSQLGAIEVGLRILPKKPEIEASLIRLVELIRDDDIGKATSEFKLFSTLFILVDGELSRTRIFSDVPPFFRRLASLAQATLIQREIMATPIDIDSFCKWAWNFRSQLFYFQSLADMRLEPRWNPDFADTSQMKAEFFGRLILAGGHYKKNISSSELQNLLLGSEPGILLSLTHSPQLCFLPGPLEGQEASPNALPDELKNAAEIQLKTEEVGPSSFAALINSALVFRVDQNQAKMAAETLRAGGRRLTNIENRLQLLAVLNGLATVAAVSRKSALADELRILVRRYRQDTQYPLSIDEALKVCLVASASRHDLNDWQESVGDWLTELAFEDFQNTEGEALHSRLRCLRNAVPELWRSCSKADAALRASFGK